MTSEASSNTAILSIASGLLGNARGLVSREKEIECATASRFNLFQILGVGHYEVSTHSALLATLLDPRGHHEQGSAFLKRFIDSEAISKAPGFPKDFDADSARVRCEVSIGTKTATTGGRLDILITDKNNKKIAIENKIHAAEQENWVERYVNFLNKNGCLIYLTKFGDKASQATCDNLKSKVHCISYAVTIKAWLEACREDVKTIPILWGSLTQYIQLINDLTHQNRNNEMNDKLVEAVLNDDDGKTFDAYCALRDANRPIKGRIIRELGLRISENLPAGISLVSIPKGNCEADDGFLFSTDFLREKNVNALVSFASSDYGDCYFGFELIERSKLFGDGACDTKRLLESFETVFGAGAISSGHWPAWQYWRPQSWNDEVLRQIKFESPKFDEQLLLLVNDLLAVEKEFSRQAKDFIPA
jgi:hypothetical protein